MIEENLEISRRMFKHACAFLDCAKYCQTETNNIEYRMHSHAVAGIVNSAFACEVYIKSLLVFHGEQVDKVKGHELTVLWEKYRNKDSEMALAIEQGMKAWFNSQNEKMFDELLDVCSNAFEYWRYIYEKSEGTVNINFLRGLALVLRSACCQAFYGMSWDDFKQSKL